MTLAHLQDPAQSQDSHIRLGMQAVLHLHLGMHMGMELQEEHIAAFISFIMLPIPIPMPCILAHMHLPIILSQPMHIIWHISMGHLHMSPVMQQDMHLAIFMSLPHQQDMGMRLHPEQHILAIIGEHLQDMQDMLQVMHIILSLFSQLQTHIVAILLHLVQHMQFASMVHMHIIMGFEQSMHIIMHLPGPHMQEDADLEQCMQHCSIPMAMSQQQKAGM